MRVGIDMDEWWPVYVITDPEETLFGVVDLPEEIVAQAKTIEADFRDFQKVLAAAFSRRSA